MAPRLMGAKAPAHGPPTIVHSAGIYADMTVDGPEIGTLVIVVDRAKNLPNLRTVGKQDPYCAARLGKEAKKTDTDKRGGQTPRWDQELRFTVHDSPDYHALKVSVFNDDKKTDLIGECWVSLDNILHPGGGKDDEWHRLNIKGRYAGEIRIELTYYDSRPKPEKPRKQSTTMMPTQTEPHAKPPGPRQSIPRRPLPSTSSNPQLYTPPAAAAASRDPYTTPQQDDYSDPYHDGSYPQAYPDQVENIDDLADEQHFWKPPHPGYQNSEDPYGHISNGRPHSAGLDRHQRPNSRDNKQQQNKYYQEQPVYQDDSDGYYNDQSYQYDAPEQANAYDYYDHSNARGPQPHRAQRLSNGPSARPAPPASIPHAHSAPVLPPQLLIQRRPEYEDFEQPDVNHRSHNQHDANGYYTNPDQSYHHDTAHHSQTGPDLQQHNFAPPPLPVHRNSAPTISQPYIRPTPVQHTTTPSRALHISTTPSDYPENHRRQESWGRSPRSATYNNSPLSQHAQQPPAPQQRLAEYRARRQQSGDAYATPSPPGSAGEYPPHLAYNADPAVRPRNELSYDPRTNYGPPRQTSGGDYYEDRPSPLTPQRPGIMSNAAHSHSSPQLPLHQPRPGYQSSPTIVKPQAISPPKAAPNNFTTPRKAVDARPTLEHVSSANAYSPDSFSALNPTHSSHSTPQHASRDPSPMYTTPGSAPRQESQQHTPEPQINSDGTIIVEGRVKDASDHLPVSSYAPEPEKKGADKSRANTRINIQNRFGPREVGNTPPSNPVSNSASASGSPRPLSMPAVETRERLYRRTHGGGSGSMGGSSPLSPAHPNSLNFNGNTSPYGGPPVPAKLPISPVKPHQTHLFQDYEAGGDMHSLAADLKMVNFKGDEDIAGGGKVKINGAGRLRKAKWSG